MNLEDIEYISKPNFVYDDVVNNFLNVPYPNSKQTFNEINQIKGIQKIYSLKESRIKFCKDVDENLDHVLIDLCNKINVDVPKNILKKTQSIGYLVVKLKQHYNRPRPYQFAYYTKQHFNPYETITGNSPSYPSGHSLQTWYLCMNLMVLYPHKKVQLEKIATLVSETRIALGVHYPSDNEFSKQICKYLMESNNNKI